MERLRSEKVSKRRITVDHAGNDTYWLLFRPRHINLGFHHHGRCTVVFLILWSRTRVFTKKYSELGLFELLMVQHLNPLRHISLVALAASRSNKYLLPATAAPSDFEDK